MKKPLVLLGPCCVRAAVGHSQAAELRVDLGQAGKAVSPSRFETFLEEPR
jgi:hypothetical protein